METSGNAVLPPTGGVREGLFIYNSLSRQKELFKPISPGRVGSHDWARYYVAPFGWLHADLSRGGGALQEAGDEELWDFYARCIGPERVITCTAFQREFDPPRRFLRIDPFDNQSGEIEYEDRGLGSRERRSRRENLGSEVL